MWPLPLKSVDLFARWTFRPRQHSFWPDQTDSTRKRAVNASDSKSCTRFGFLTVVEAQTGLVGGYLVVNEFARPTEFHCTAPVVADKAQQILFGSTLAPYLYGETIGQALVKKTSHLPPTVIFTDTEPALAVRAFVDSPVALVLSKSALPEGMPVNLSAQTHRLDEAHNVPRGHGSSLVEFGIGSHRLAVSERFATEQDDLASRWQPYAANFDLHEPFERIREAIDETQLRNGGV